MVGLIYFSFDEKPMVSMEPVPSSEKSFSWSPSKATRTVTLVSMLYRVTPVVLEVSPLISQVTCLPAKRFRIVSSLRTTRVALNSPRKSSVYVFPSLLGVSLNPRMIKISPGFTSSSGRIFDLPLAHFRKFKVEFASFPDLSFPPS